MSVLIKKLGELFKLQLIDNEIIENRRRIRRLEEADSVNKKRYNEYLAKLANIDGEIKPIQDRAKEIKDENGAHLEKKRNCEDRLFNADTDPRDLQFLQKEREQVINLIKRNEDELVRLMVQVDSTEIRKKDLQDKIDEIEPEYKREMAGRLEEIKTLTARVDELRKERQVFKDFDEKRLLSKYSALQKTHDGVAISTVTEDGVCDGCFVEVSKATLTRIIESDEVVTCQRCGRILYYPDAEKAGLL